MSPGNVTLLLSSIATGISVLAILVSLSFRFGSASGKLENISKQQDKMELEMVRKTDLLPLQTQLAEIRGMFRLELKGD